MAGSDNLGKVTIDLSGDTSSENESMSVRSTNALAEEERELNEAIALSLQSTSTSTSEFIDPSAGNAANGTGRETVYSTTTKAISVGIPGIDRKKQEEERLARLKRKGGPSVSPPTLAKQRTPTIVGDYHRAKTRDPNSTITRNVCLESDSLEPKLEESRSGLKYPDWVVKRTWAFGIDRRDDIKIDEVLDRSKLESAVLSAFQWDWDWLLPKMDTQRTKFVFVLQAKEERIKQKYRADFLGVANVRLCFPSMEGQVNCMHSKLMLLFYPTHLRIAIPTANLVPYDWGEPFGTVAQGVMENTVALIDLPRRELGEKANSDIEVPFLESLVYFVTAMGLQEDVVKKLQTFDFSKTAYHGFIHSIGGAHRGQAWRRTGACGLGGFLNQMGLRTTDPVHIDYVTSSLGNVDDNYLRSLYLIAQGDSGLAEYTLRTGKAIPSGNQQDLQGRVRKDFSNEWKQNLRIHYPSDETIHLSKGGTNCAGTVCFQSRWWHGPKFPRGLMRDCRSQREGLLMHNKIWYTQYTEPLHMKSGRQALGWAYVGSANLSESAWGRLVQDRATKTPKLNCRNWECGVVLPILSEQNDERSPQGPDERLSMFKNAIPIPMVLPGEPYPAENDSGLHAPYDGKRKISPWFSS